MSCLRREDGEKLWRTPDGVHVDVRGREPPEPMIAILQLIDSGEVDSVLFAYLDREPIFLYPELDDRGWSHEIVPCSCSDPCGEEVVLQVVRLQP